MEMQKPCGGYHCKCMNLDGKCENHHYCGTCPDNPQKRPVGVKAESETYQPIVCGQCDQTIDYRISLSKVHVFLMAKFAAAVRAKGVNYLSATKELETGKYGPKWGSNEIKRLSQVRFHGLIAMGGEGNCWLLTTKGAKFLRGMPVPRHAIVLKRNKRTSEHTTGYWDQGHTMVTARDLLKEKDYFAQIDFTIRESRIILEKDLPAVGGEQGAML